MKSKKKLLIVAIFTAISVLLGFIESLIPPVFSFLPYARIEISNIIVFFTVICFGLGEGILVMGIKSLVVGLISSNPFMILYFLVSGLLAVIVEYFLLKLDKLGIPSIGAVSGLFIAFGQIAMASILTGSTAPFVYFPHLAIFGMIQGLIVGVITWVLVKYIPTNLIYSKNGKDE